MQVGSAAHRAPKGKKAKAGKSAYLWGHVGSAPASAYLLAKALGRRGPAAKIHRLFKNPTPKN